MRLALLIFALSFFNLNSFSQSYIPLVKDSVHWFVAFKNQFTPPGEYQSIYEYYCIGDTLINSTTYKKVYKRDVEAKNNDFQAPYRPLNSYSLYAVLREDTTLKRVYSILFQSGLYTNDCSIGQEELLYDFNMSLGDTINDSMCIAVPPLPDKTITNVISTSKFGYLTYEYERGGQNFYPAYYYAGIGTWCGLFEPEQDIETFILWDYCIGNETTCSLTNSIKSYEQKNINIYPNPTIGIINIKTSFDFDNIKIYQQPSGKLLKTLSNNTKINISDLPKGMYFIELIGEKRSVIKKLIKE